MAAPCPSKSRSPCPNRYPLLRFPSSSTAPAGAPGARWCLLSSRSSCLSSPPRTRPRPSRSQRTSHFTRPSRTSPSARLSQCTCTLGTSSSRATPPFMLKSDEQRHSISLCRSSPPRLNSSSYTQDIQPLLKPVSGSLCALWAVHHSDLKIIQCWTSSRST